MTTGVHTFSAMGTTFWLQAEGVDDEALRSSERLVREAEARLSRFLPGSSLSQLNSRREASDPMLALVAREALRARELTRGAFDPTVGDSLIAAGYDRSFEHLSTTTGPSRAEGGRPDVTIEGDTVRLTGRGALDLGGIAKGWTVDRVAEQLAMAGATGWLVDGGGDIRVGGQAPAGEWHLGIGDDHAIGLTEGAVATSSSLQRRWRTAEGEAHHIIDPRTGQPALGLVDTAVVIARDAGTADVLATALIADFDATWPALARCDAAALVHSAVNGWRMTSNLKELLR